MKLIRTSTPIRVLASPSNTGKCSLLKTALKPTRPRALRAFHPAPRCLAATTSRLAAHLLRRSA
ncbi:hypothetical protein KCP78_14140 [Salmonella enterica subsp. enterica]|nr:hypothetical protein KCP78_14140 [Salmonella enterica subsp. enterica]